MTTLEFAPEAPVAAAAAPVEYDIKQLAVGMPVYVYAVCEDIAATGQMAGSELACYGEISGVPGESTSLNSAPTYVSVREIDQATGDFIEHPEFPNAVVSKVFWPQRARFFDRLLTNSNS